MVIKQKHKGKIYRVPLRKRLLLWGFVLIVLSGFGLSAISPTSEFIGDDGYQWGRFLLVGAIFGALTLAIYWYTFRTYLLVDENGIEIHGFQQIRMEWDNIERIGFREGIGTSKRRNWGVFSREAVPVHQILGTKSQSHTDNFIQLDLVGIKPRYRDLNIARAKFSETALGQDFLRYAPHLFDDINV